MGENRVGHISGQGNIVGDGGVINIGGSCSAGGSLTNPQLSGMVILIGTPETMIILKINSYL